MKTIEVSDVVAKYIEAHGRFGESSDEVLRRCLKDFSFFERSTQPRDFWPHTESPYHTEVSFPMSDGVAVLSETN